MPGLSANYAMHNAWYPDPRLNLSWQLPLVEQSADLTFYAAYGWHTKLPVSAHLFTAPNYYDISELNYYSRNPELRSLFILTKIIEPINFGLKPAVNKKMETGVKLALGKVQLDLTLFYENCNNGFAYKRNYETNTYRRYDYSNIDPNTLTAPPDTTGMPYKLRKGRLWYGTANNQKLIEKKGVEYVLSFPKWELLATRILISGAWFRSNYDIVGERFFQPNTVVLGEPYPYIGIYDYYDKGSTKEEFTTRISLNTHIPKLRLIFSNDFFLRWYSSRQNNYDIGRPIAYIDRENNRQDFNSDDLPDPLLKELLETHSSNYFDPDFTPVYFSLNQKITKEIKDKIRISFYISSLIAFQPEYTINSGAKMKNYYRPSFGAEINIRI